jgi:exodeoxyribonuclease-3
MSLRIATWNVNSVRQRMVHIERLIAEHAPDVLCLQETKVANDGFPLEPIEVQGYHNHVIHGQKGYNGVAIFSRHPLERSDTRVWTGKDDCRHAQAQLPCGIEVHCFYVPSGGPTPDRQANDKFAHKLDFLTEMAEWARADHVADRKVVLLGDLNVAPLKNDVWNHRRLLRSVGHTPIESEHMERLAQAGSFVDVGRHFVPPDQPLYTWWGYRFPQSFQRNYGWRLDHVWVTPPLAGALTDMTVVSDTRTWEKPSDHVPVIVDIG